MKYFKKIAGERIYLSPMNVEDAEIYLKWLSDRSTSDGIHNTAVINNIQTEKEWIEKTLTSEEPSFSIVLNDGDKLIGNCGIMKINHIDGTATLGIFIGEENNRNHGYGSEALRLLLDFGFKILNLHNIDLKVFSFNERAIACYKKIGFKEYGRRHECYYLDGKYHDEILMELLKEDYLEISNKIIKL